MANTVDHDPHSPIQRLLDWATEHGVDRDMKDRRFAKALELNASLCQIPMVKVAGTNGKGSVCAMLEACLLADGKRTGMFTSPHMTRITERLRINGAEMARDALNAHAAALHPFFERLVAEYGPAYLPSFFEMLVLIALKAFHDAGVSFAVYEAGIGGYNCPMSVLPTPVSVITTVGLDHQDRLGPTLEAIAADKAGIASPSSLLVLGAEIAGSVREVIAADAAKRGVTIRQATLEGLEVEPLGVKGYRVVYRRGGQVIAMRLPLLGDFQLSNLATVITVLERLVELGLVSSLRCLEGIAHTYWPGRLEYVPAGAPGAPAWLLDGAHNAHAFRALADGINTLVDYDQRVLLYGASQGHDYAASIQVLPSLAPAVYLFDGFYRAVSAETLLPLLPPGIAYRGVYSDIADAVAGLTADPEHRGKVIIVAGSIFMMGSLRDHLAGNGLVGRTAGDPQARNGRNGG